MEQIFVASPKGGCGKTTISAQIAAYYAIEGKKVLLVDHDALRCSSDWLSSRPDTKAKIDCVIAAVEDHIDYKNADCVVHDMPAAWTLDNLRNIIHNGDKVLVPVLPSPNDIKACLRFFMKLHRSGVLEEGIHVGLIANRARANTKYFSVLLEFLERLNIPLVTVLRDTQTYVRVMDEGLSIFDVAVSKARKDLEQWQPLLDWLDEHPQNAEPLEQMLQPAAAS